MTLAQEARILMLDEPTTFLDPTHQLEILGLDRNLVRQRGATVVAVLHDLNHAAQFADRILLLCAGEGAADGLARDFLVPDILAQAFGIEVDILQNPRSGAPVCVPWLASDTIATAGFSL